jgi:hypothetical protein
MADEASATEKWNALAARAKTDAELRRRLLATPQEVLAEEGIDVPDGVAVRVVENTPGVLTLVLPAPNGDDAVADEDLDAISGGEIM